jgi:hypothetical protein
LATKATPLGTRDRSLGVQRKVGVVPFGVERDETTRTVVST